MINFFYLKIFFWLLNIIDYPNKKKIINFFKTRLGKKPINLIDIGAHKGENIDLFINNMNINKIYAFEPNFDVYKRLSLNKKYQKDMISIFNLGVGKYNEKKILNVLNETSSSTINSINENTKYFQRKKRVMSFFSKKNFFKEKQEIQICNLSDFIKKNNIENIDILKIDTEGFEYNVISGIEVNDFRIIKYIYFEHHYDLMLKKDYNFSDINSILIDNNFKLKFKVKMKFRKVFEYIYERNN